MARKLHLSSFKKQYAKIIDGILSRQTKRFSDFEKDLIYHSQNIAADTIKKGFKENYAPTVKGIIDSSFQVIYPEYRKIYKISKYFGNVLKEANCDVSAKYMDFSKTRHFCIEFPDDMSFDAGDGERAECAYVQIYGRGSITSKLFHHGAVSLGKRAENSAPTDIITITCPTRTDNRDSSYIQFSIHIEEGEELRKALDDDDDRGRCEFRDIREYVLKCIMYIDSGDPDLSDLKPTRAPHNPKKLEKWLREDRFEYQVTRIGFHYAPKYEQHIFDCKVRGHWRWQPYGVGLSKVKLIFIEEHIRTYGNVNIGPGFSEPLTTAHC